jgi:hypothetical protein
MCYFLADGNIFSKSGNKSAPTPLFPSTAILLLCLSPDEVQTSATVYTVIETAKANGPNPERYISLLLTILPERFVKDPKAAVDALVPWAEDILSCYSPQ